MVGKIQQSKVMLGFPGKVSLPCPPCPKFLVPCWGKGSEVRGPKGRPFSWEIPWNTVLFGVDSEGLHFFLVAQQEESLHPNARERKEYEFKLDKEGGEIKVTSSWIVLWLGPKILLGEKLTTMLTGYVVLGHLGLVNGLSSSRDVEKGPKFSRLLAVAENKPGFFLPQLSQLLSLLHILSRGNSTFIQHCLTVCQEDFRPPLLLFPVLSEKMTFSILKDECCWKNLDSCNQKRREKTNRKTYLKTLQKMYGAVGEKSYSSGSHFAFHMCTYDFRHFPSHMTLGKLLNLSSSVPVWAQQISFQCKDRQHLIFLLLLLYCYSLG